nr:hypothetical protein [uncultured Sphingorhabdus sp.]
MKETLRFWPSASAVGLTLAMFVWQFQFEYGWLQMATSWLFWVGAIVWGYLVFLGIKRWRHWWLLLTAPIVLYPIGLFTVLIVACSQGNCL